MARKRKTIPRQTRRFHVVGEVSSLSHGPDVYPVRDASVELPAADTWYRALIDCGTLVLQPAEGENNEDPG